MQQRRIKRGGFKSNLRITKSNPKSNPKHV